MSEPIENEIEEELRRKQIKSLWDRFGLYLIAIILIIIISFGGYEFSSYLSRNNSEAASDEYQKAIMAVNEDRINDAEDIFNSLINESNGYSGLSLFNLANIYYSKGEKDIALDYLQKAHENKNLTQKIREFAILKSGYIMLDDYDTNEIEKKLSILNKSSGAFSFYAKEIIALAYYRDKKFSDSSKKFIEIANDASSPRNIASRAKIFSDQIQSYDGLK